MTEGSVQTNVDWPSVWGAAWLMRTGSIVVVVGVICHVGSIALGSGSMRGGSDLGAALGAILPLVLGDITVMVVVGGILATAWAWWRLVKPSVVRCDGSARTRQARTRLLIVVWAILFAGSLIWHLSHERWGPLVSRLEIFVQISAVTTTIIIVLFSAIVAVPLLWLVVRLCRHIEELGMVASNPQISAKARDCRWVARVVLCVAIIASSARFLDSAVEAEWQGSQTAMQEWGEAVRKARVEGKSPPPKPIAPSGWRRETVGAMRATAFLLYPGLVFLLVEYSRMGTRLLSEASRRAPLDADS